MPATPLVHAPDRVLIGRSGVMGKEVATLRKIVAAVKNFVAAWSRSIETAVKRIVDPARDRANVLAGAAHDTVRPRAELIAENALLRQQLIVVRRRIKRPIPNDGDRIMMVLLARLDRAWRDALHLVKPDTLLRWHRDLFKLIWRRTSRSGRGQPKRLYNPRRTAQARNSGQ